MDDDGRGGLLGDHLHVFGEGDADGLELEKFEQGPVHIQVGQAG